MGAFWRVGEGRRGAREGVWAGDGGREGGLGAELGEFGGDWGGFAVLGAGCGQGYTAAGRWGQVGFICYLFVPLLQLEGTGLAARG